MSNISATIEELEAKLYALHPKAKELYNLIGSLKQFNIADFDNNVPPVTIIKGSGPKLVYDKSAPVHKKILFALNYWGHPAKVGDIESIIKEYEPNFDKQFSTPLRVLKEENLIDTFNPTGSNRDMFYGLSEWFESPNKLKEGITPL